MASPHISFLVAFHKSVLGAEYRKSAEERGAKRNVTFMLFLNGDGKVTKIGWASLYRPADAASGTLQGHMENQPLANNDGSYRFATCAPVMVM